MTCCSVSATKFGVLWAKTFLDHNVTNDRQVGLYAVVTTELYYYIEFSGGYNFDSTPIRLQFY